MIGTVEERFWSKVEIIPGHECWEWTGGKNRGGYGTFYLAGRTLGSHRVSYELNIGPIQEGLSVLHRCDNPGCIRPEHLFAGNQTDNISDMIAKGRHYRYGKTHCEREIHELNEENSYIDSSGGRRCRLCRKARYLENREARLDQQKAYNEVNRDRITARKRARYLENREAVLAERKSYRDSNRERINARKRALYRDTKAGSLRPL